MNVEEEKNVQPPNLPNPKQKKTNTASNIFLIVICLPAIAIVLFFLFAALYNFFTGVGPGHY